MREIIRHLTKIVAETMPIAEPIYEFGSFQVPDQIGFADLRPFFLGYEYVGCDMRDGPGVDRILNLHSIELPDESVGTVLIMDTLEHVEFCREAMSEVYRILKPDGILAMSSHMDCPIHNHPADYWRFTPAGFESLLQEFPFSYVEFVGDELFPETVVGISCKGNLLEENLEEFVKEIGAWKVYWSNLPLPKPTTREIIKRFLPPITLDIYRKIRYGA